MMVKQNLVIWLTASLHLLIIKKSKFFITLLKNPDPRDLKLTSNKYKASKTLVYYLIFVYTIYIIFYNQM